MVQVLTAVLRSADGSMRSRDVQVHRQKLTILALPLARASIQASTEPQSAIRAKQVTSQPRTVLQSVGVVQQVAWQRRLGQITWWSAGRVRWLRACATLYETHSLTVRDESC